jgi:hypothetical protein
VKEREALFLRPVNERLMLRMRKECDFRSVGGSTGWSWPDDRGEAPIGAEMDGIGVGAAEVATGGAAGGLIS